MKRYIKLFLFSLIIFAVGLTKAFADENIELVKVELQEKSDYVEINEEVSLEDNKIISNVNFYDEGDYVIYKLTIKNNDNKNYVINEIKDNNDSEYLEFKYTYDSLIKAKEEKEVLLKITYKSLLPYDTVLTPNNEFNTVNEIGISISFEEEVKNPNTFGNIHITIAIIAIITLAILIIFKDRKKKYILILILLILIGLPSRTKARIEFKVNFALKNTMNMKVNFLDKYWKSKLTGTFNKIEFIKTLEYPEEAVDVSAMQDESIKAWIENNKVYIGSKYKIFFPSSSVELLSRSGVNEITFNNRIDTTFVTDMGYLFANDSFTNIDLSDFRTGNAIYMNSMFYNNPEIEKIDVSNFDTSKVTTIGNAFKGCPKLEELIIDNWDLTNLTSGRNYYVDFQYALKKISAKNLVFPPDSSQFFYPGYNGSTVESIDLTDSDTSKVTNMESMFQYQFNLKEIKGIEDWDTSKVTNMSYIFSYAASRANGGTITLDLSKWDVANVERMYMGFYEFGTALDEININIEGWNSSKLTDTTELFRNLGTNAKTVNITIKDINLSAVTKVDYWFYRVGNYSENVNVEIDGMSMGSLKNPRYMFESFADNAGKVKLYMNDIYWPRVNDVFHFMDYAVTKGNDVEIILSNWKFEDLTNTNEMFYYMAHDANKLVFECTNFEMPNTTSMATLFYGIGVGAKDITFKVKNLDTSSLQNASNMFKNIGRNTEKMVVEGIDEIDFSGTTDIYDLFEGSLSPTSEPVDIGTIDIYATSLGYSFHNAHNVKAVVNIHNKPSSYLFMFDQAATGEGSEIIVNYTADVTNIDEIINTKSSNSNVIKGQLIE